MEKKSKKVVKKEESRELVVLDSVMSPVESVKLQMATINELYQSVMQDDVHYGVIPGTQKPTLYQAGAQKIMFMFKLAPSYEVTQEWFRDMTGKQTGHLNVSVKCILKHRDTGLFWGEGVGSASTLEKKHRYRETASPVKSVPKEYWDTKDLSLLDGMKPRKVDGSWMLCRVEKVENPDIADIYNTVLKMAKKRALVDAVSTVTGVSDIFTQDMEDFIETPKNSAPQVAKGSGSFNKIQIVDRMRSAKNIEELVEYATVSRKFIKDNPDKFNDEDKQELDEVYKDMTKKLKEAK